VNFNIGFVAVYDELEFHTGNINSKGEEFAYCTFWHIWIFL